MSDPQVVPHHISIVMVGSGRWATRRLLLSLAGHQQGVEALRRCARACVQRGVAVAREVPQLQKDGVRLYFVGARADLAPKVRADLAQAEAATAANARLVLNVCFNYGGRWDIAQAAAALAARGEPI